MSQYYKVAELSKISTLTMYRMLLKNLKLYPSTNRFDIMIAMQDEFHNSRKITDPEQARKSRTKAEMGLRHVLYYIEKNELVKQNKYHDNDDIEPFAKSKEETVYF